MRVNRPVRCLLFISLRSRHPHPQTHSIKLGCYGIGTTVATPTHCCHQLQIESLNLIHPLATPLKLPFKLFEALYHLGTIFGHQLKWRSWWFSRGIMWPYPIPQLLLDNSHASSPHGVYSHKNNIKNSFLVRCNHWVLHSGCDPISCHDVHAVWYVLCNHSAQFKAQSGHNYIEVAVPAIHWLCTYTVLNLAEWRALKTTFWVSCRVQVQVLHLPVR